MPSLWGGCKANGACLGGGCERVTVEGGEGARGPGQPCEAALHSGQVLALGDDHVVQHQRAVGELEVHFLEDQCRVQEAHVGVDQHHLAAQPALRAGWGAQLAHR
jgi:hypothetical protein